MKKEEYNRILEQNIVPPGLQLNVAGLIFQQDNDPKNRSKLFRVKRKPGESVLKNIIWPPQSPDP